MKSNEKINTKTLLKHSFDVMKLLKVGAIGVDSAKAHSQLLKQSNNILRYELDKAIAIEKYESLNIKDIEE